MTRQPGSSCKTLLCGRADAPTIAAALEILHITKAYFPVSLLRRQSGLRYGVLRYTVASFPR